MYFYLYYIPVMKIIKILNNHDMITIGYDYGSFDMHLYRIIIRCYNLVKIELWKFYKYGRSHILTFRQYITI